MLYMLADGWIKSAFLGLFITLFVIVALLLILIILIQKGRGGGLASAFGGGGGNTAFGSKTGDVLTWATSIMFGVFVLLAIILNLMTRDFSKPAVATNGTPVPVTTPAPAPAPAPAPKPASGTGATSGDIGGTNTGTTPAVKPAPAPTTNPSTAIPAPAISAPKPATTRPSTTTPAIIGSHGSNTSDLPDKDASTLFKPATERDVTAPYKIAPPDKVVIRAAAIKELNGAVMQVRPDGKIAVNLLGDIDVANKTPEEIGKSLSAAAEKYYNHPDIKVEVAEYQSKFYQVFGTGIRDPGKKPHTGRNTLISALASAGFNEDAWPQQVSLSRPAADGHPRATAIIDMKKLCAAGDTQQNYVIQENDIIYVPEAPLIAWEKDARKILTSVISGDSAAPVASPRIAATTHTPALPK